MEAHFFCGRQRNVGPEVQAVSTQRETVSELLSDADMCLLTTGHGFPFLVFVEGPGKAATAARGPRRRWRWVSGCADDRIFMTLDSHSHKCLRREMNILDRSQRERDYIVNILGPLFSDLLLEFDIGRFQLYWVEKVIRSVTSRKRRYMHAEYTQLSHDCHKVDMLLELRNYKVELLSLEVGNTDMDYDETKERVDRSELTIQLKDTLDQYRYVLHFKKEDMEKIFTIGILVSGNRWTIYAMKFDASAKFYFMTEMGTLTIPTTLSAMADQLPPFIESMLSLRHTLLQLNQTVQAIARQRLRTPSPPSSPLGDTIPTPEVKKKKD
ncbi:hypothetical protein BC938DRAFT_471830 [Jimgerdemannia flammicorona]|uniref:Uncharacterized protein n=1 Tax=Jimgerdemannia flammicorona TaxID=994334 RepID=A0A433QUJ2_9FUNG|nr:hypothetical protein BC938DRAFT_471830 [Jimgerdemannia flammicorona]